MQKKTPTAVLRVYRCGSWKRICDRRKEEGRRYFPRNFILKTEHIFLQVVQDGLRYRSAECYNSFEEKRGIKMCSRCRVAKTAANKRIESLRRKKILCEGLERHSFEQLINDRRWESERSQFSPARFHKETLFSLKCDGQKLSKHRRCRHCTKLRATLYELKRRKPDERKRLLYSNQRYLSDEDKVRKAFIVN